MGMFYLTIFFGIGYLALYPGLGKWAGLRGWTSVGQYKEERSQAEAKYQPLYDKYLKQDVKAVAADKEAQEMGKRLFQTYCIQCHGSDARGAKGFPNLTDNDWLYGGSPEQILQTLNAGRQGQMPAFGAAFGEEKVKDVANYVMSLSGKKHDAERAGRGKETFSTVCAACHGPDGKGNQAMGAPNLTDNIWLYGGTEKTIIETVTNGRANQMPAWKDFLGDGKVHLLTAYVWGLSNNKAAAQ
jgi:cytochrome c oxidase cbb3-type subunit 3